MEDLSRKTGVSKFLMVTLIVLAIIVAGGGVWYFMDKKASNDRAALSSQIADLRNDVNKLEKSADAASTTTESMPVTTTSKISTADSSTTICGQLFPGSKATMDEAAVGDTVCTVTNTSGDFAIGNSSGKIDETGGPGTAWIAAKVAGTWTKIQSSQDAWDCVLLKKYSFPSSLLGDNTTCYNSSTGANETYKN